MFRAVCSATFESVQRYGHYGTEVLPRKPFVLFVKFFGPFRCNFRFLSLYLKANIKSQTMATLFTLPVLPYALQDLDPVISKQTMEFHYGKHLQAYVNQLNALAEGTPFATMTLEEIIQQAPAGPLFNNAGQVYNHTQYFLQFQAPASGEHAPSGRLLNALVDAFGSFDAFCDRMTAAATGLFGSGWLWLVQHDSGKLELLPCPNADNPVKHGLNGLMCFDVWEHAYYLDYQNRRADHLKALWRLINWQVVENRMI